MTESAALGEPVVVVGGLLIQHGSILLCHRRPDRAWYPDVWDVPGGHPEQGETLEDALVRELGEELGVTVHAASLATVVELWNVDAVLHLIEVRRWKGVPHNAAPEEHDEIRWFGPDDLARLELADPSFRSVLVEVLAR